MSDIQIIVFLLFIIASCNLAALITRPLAEVRFAHAVMAAPVIVFVIVLLLRIALGSVT